VGFPTNFLALLNHFRCKVCALCKGARGYQRSTRVQLHRPHKTLKAVPAPGDIVFCNSNDNSTIGVVTAVLLDDLFTVLMPTQHTQTFSLSNLSLAEEIIDTDNGTADVGEDTGHTPCAVDESATDAATPLAGDNAASNLSLDFAYALSLGYLKEEYYLLIHADAVEMLWCALTTSRAQPHELIQEFLNYSGIQVGSIRFDNAMEFCQSDHFKSWAKAKGAVLCPAVNLNYNYTLNSKSKCYVRITNLKEHLHCMLLSSNAPRRHWPFALQHFCRIFGWWPKANGIAPWKRVSSECHFTANLDRDLHTFGSYYIGHLPRESKLVENTTLDDRGLEGAFLMSDHSTPTFWTWSFKFNKPMKMCDGIFNPTYPFRDPSVLQHACDLSHEDICAMHAVDGVFDQDDVSVLQCDLRSHAAPVHDAPSHAASIERRQQVDASHVIGDANAQQGQTRARAHHSPQLAAAAPPAPATQIYAAPSVLTRKDYRDWTLGVHVPVHAELELLSDIQLGRALLHHQYMLELPVGYFQHPNTANTSQAVTVVANATSKIKGFVYLLADIIGPATLLQDNLAELHVPIRSGNTPRTEHSYTIRNHLNAVFAHPQTLAHIRISKQAHLTHLEALHTAWQNTRRATIKHQVQLGHTADHQSH